MTTIEKKPKPADTPDPNDRPDCEEVLDEAIADSMVASDPPAAVSKGVASAPPRPASEDAKGPAGKEDLPHQKKS